MPAEKFDRLVSQYDRQPDGMLKEEPRTPARRSHGLQRRRRTCSPPPADYVKFTQMILRHGRAADGRQILQPKTVEQMSANQIGALGAGS